MLLHHKFYAKLKKCEFFKQSTVFLGHRVGEHGVSIDHDKIASVIEWPQPTNVKEVQSFLGFA